MGNRGRPTADVAKREKKKKGHPSLLDLQKRSLRQQQQQQNKPSPNPNPNRQFPQSSFRRATRRNPNPPQEDPRPSLPQGDQDEDENEEQKQEEGGGSGAKRKEKKLKFVLDLPSRLAGSCSDSEGPEPKRSKISHGDRDKKVRTCPLLIMPSALRRAYKFWSVQIHEW